MTPEVDVRSFPPVEQNVEAPEKFSQSSLAKLDSCPRSAYLYFKYGGGAGSAAMAAGSAFHAFAEKATWALVASGDHQMPADVGRDLMSVVLSERKDLIVPEEFHDDLRQGAWNWCESTYIEKDRIISIEEMWEVEVAGWKLRGKIDLAESEGSGLARVRDYKFSLNLPSQDEVARGFQLRFYCFLLAQGAPEGTERELPPLARVAAENVYPRYTDSESGEMVTRGFEMDANEIADFRRSLELLVERAEHGLDTAEWPAQPGSHCSRCPAPQLCPIPEYLNPHLPLSDAASAQETAAVILDLDRQKRALTKALREWAKEYGAVQCGDYEFDFVLVESKVLDKEALNRVYETGEMVSIDELYKKRVSTRFDRRKIGSRNGSTNQGGSE